MILLLLAALVLLIFLFTDAWYFVRFFVDVKLRKWPDAKDITVDDLFVPTITRHIVLPSDIDVWMHMNNSKYLRESDFGRMNYLMAKGLFRALVEQKMFIVAGSISIRYRREFKVFQTFTIATRIVYWDDKNTYLEQRFMRKGFVHAISYVQARFIGGTPFQLVAKACNLKAPMDPPKPSPELAAILRFNEESSRSLNPSK